ncbi:MAG: ATP-binding protein [bacterium]
MSFTRKLSIKRKLLFLTTIISLVALSSAFVGIAVYQTYAFREVLKNDLTSLAKFIAYNSTPSVVFEDSKAAGDALNFLMYKKNITGACIYTPDGKIFAYYHKPGIVQNFPEIPEIEGTKFEDDKFLIFQPIAYQDDDEIKGILYLESSLEGMYFPLKKYLVILLVIMPIPLLIAFLLSSSLQGRISKPIERLARTARAVSEQKDYTARVKNESDDEIGTFINCFNEMLCQIQARDKELQEARDDLEKRVAERIQDLKKEIAERKKAEQLGRELQEKLARSERMESLGILAGGVAHDLNNILGPVVGYPDLILDELPPDSPVREDIVAIRDSAIRASAVIQDLLTLARRGCYQAQVISINDVIHTYMKSPAFTSKIKNYPKIQVKVNLGKDSLAIKGSVSHLTQVVMNLVNNALEEMRDSGSLAITTNPEYVPHSKQVYNRSMHEGNYVVLQVADTGQGIKQENIKHIFEPFYTKKQMGRSGTGLGLSVVYGVVTDLDGFVEVETKEGRGTKFCLYFPVVSIEEKVRQESEPDIHGSEKILVVDDDGGQRALAAKLLTTLGYHTMTAEDGHEAVNLANRQFFDLIILDMILEDDFDGLDTYKKILEARQDQRCIIASGFSETDRVREVLSLGSSYYLRKPYTLSELGKAVRLALDTPEKGQERHATEYQIVLEGTKVQDV